MTGHLPDHGEPRIESWGDPEWRALATSWLDDQLQAAGLERSGDVTQPHVHPWATVLSAPTRGGRVWLKAMAPGTTFEVGLYELLVPVAPGNVLTPIASDPSRGWILLPDGGASLADRLTGSDLLEHMLIALPQYAQLQRSTMPHVGTLLDLGLSDLRPSLLPGRYDDALAAYLDADISAQLISLRPRFVDWCLRLAESPIGASLEHNDLHPWNILGVGSGVPASAPPTTAIFYDWGDSVVAHPFGSAVGSVSRVRRMLRRRRDHQDVRRMREAYLEGFDDLAGRRDLDQTLDLACQVAKAARAVVWDRSEGSVREYLGQVARGDIGI
jgi:hypothetical protein